MCHISMDREVFILRMNRAKLVVISKYAKGEIGRNEYFDKIEKINGALLNDKLGLNIYR